MKKNLFLLSLLAVSGLEAYPIQGMQQVPTLHAGTSRTTNPTISRQQQIPAATGQVTFYSNGGSGSMEPLKGLAEGQEFQLPKNTFTRQGYRFVGWSNTAGSDEPMYQDAFSRFPYYPSNSTLYAIWEPEATALRISFNGNGGEGSMEPIYVRANQTIIVPPHQFIPADKGYECKGYGLSPDDYTRYRIGGTARFTSSCTLYAFWSPLDGSIGGACEEFKGQSVFVEGVHVPDEDWVQTSTNPVKYFAEWKAGRGWYDVDQDWLNFCWAATGSNVIHWWLDRNKKYIQEYRKTHDVPEFKYYGKGVSDVFRHFVRNWVENKGDLPTRGFDWFINGIDDGVQASAKGKGGFFKDVFGNNSLAVTYNPMSRRTFNECVVDALKNNRMLSIDESNISGSHAITFWGAEFDENGYVKALYYVDSATAWNNSLLGRDLSLGKIDVIYREDQNWRPYMQTSVLINGVVQHGLIPIVTVYSYDKGTEYWEEYFATQGQESYTLVCQDENGKNFQSQTLKAEPGAAITLPAFPFRKVTKAMAGDQELTISSEGTVSTAEASGKEITLQYADNLPFEITTVSNGNFTDAHWYLMGSNGSGALKLMQYDAQNQEHIQVTTLTEGHLLDESKLWCISGNVTDGFRLYNKAAGSSLAVTYTQEDGKAAMSSPENDMAVWFVATASGQEDDQMFCFQSKNINYGKTFLCVANQEVTFGTAKESVAALKAMNQTEVLSLTAPEFESRLQGIPNGAVGGPADRNAVKQAIETLKSNPSTAHYQAVCDAFENKTALNLHKVYYLLGTDAQNAVAVQQDGFFQATSRAAAKANGIFLLEPTANGAYRISVQGEYLGAAKSNNQNNAFGLEGRTLNGSKIKQGTFALIDGGSARFYLQNTNTEAGSNSYVHLNGQTVSACGDRVDGTQWYLVEAPALDITITEAGYATAHYPFAVKLPQDGSLKAYTGSVSNKGEDHQLLLEELPGEWIPANTAVILAGKANTYTLAISAADEGSTTNSNNVLEGTLLPKAVTAKDYILSNKNGVIGFYKVAANDLNLGANKAYLPGMNIPASAEGAGRFIISFREDGDGTTGIESDIITDNAPEELYDLQGRRVLHPTEGVYVTKSGKKVLISR